MGDVKKFIELEAKAPIVELTNVPVTIPYQIGMLQNLEEGRRAHRLRCIEIAYKEILGRVDGQADHTISEHALYRGAAVAVVGVRPEIKTAIELHVEMLMSLYDAAVMESLERQNEMRAHFAAVCDAMRAKAGGVVS